MSEENDVPAVIDFAEARQQRLHDIHEARLAKVRAAFEKALPLPKSAKLRSNRKGRKKPKR